MPVTLAGPSRIGFGLWNHPVLSVTVELLLFALGVWLYIGSTKARNLKGSMGFWALVIFLLAVYAGNIVAPPPPSAEAVAWSAQALWLLVVWGFWVDYNRSVKKSVLSDPVLKEEN